VEGDFGLDLPAAFFLPLRMPARVQGETHPALQNALVERALSRLMPLFGPTDARRARLQHRREAVAKHGGERTDRHVRIAEHGRFAEAEKIASPNLETLRRVYGENDLWTIVSERTLATLYRAQGRYKDAERIFAELLDHLRRGQSPGGVDLAVTTTNLGVVYFDEGEEGPAESTLTDALALDRNVHPDERVTRTCLTALARLRLKQQRFAEAESLLREAMNGTGNQNAEIWDTFDRQSLLGASLLGQDKFAEAEPLLIAGYEGLKKLNPAISVEANLPQAGDRLVQLYAAWEKPGNADEWRRRLKAPPQ